MVSTTEDAGRYLGLQKVFRVGDGNGKVAIVLEGSTHGNWLVKEGRPEARAASVINSNPIMK